MEVEGAKNVAEDCDLSILSEIQNGFQSTLVSKAIDFVNKFAYFDLSNGIEEELCVAIISRWCIQNDRESASTQEQEAKDVLQILRDNNLICEVKRTKSPNCVFFQMQRNLQKTILAQNEHNFSFIIDLAKVLKCIWMDMCWALCYKSHIFHIHKCLKQLGWPGDTIKLSVCLVSPLFNDETEASILADVTEHMNAANQNLSEIDWITVQMVQIHKDTLSKSRKVLQPSDTIFIKDTDGQTQEIRLDNYGSWILNQIRIYSIRGADCDALTAVAANSLERLQKHARFCNKPDDLTLNWIIAYSGREWHSFNCFAALACYLSDEWLAKLCRAYIRKLGEKVECCEKSEFSLKDSYCSWVRLRELVKKSRVQHELIAALCDEEGLQFMEINFLKCATTLDSKEYCLKYQAQTVIEILEPLLVIGRSEIVAKLLRRQSFWRFITLVLLKHPFISERYNLELENDLLCACEIYLDLLVALCNRKDDAIDDGFLISFFMEDYIQAYTTVVRGATEIVETRQLHTCMYYLFTVLFTVLTNLPSDDLVTTYVSDENIQKEIDDYSACDNATFDVADGCLREHRKSIKSFCDLYSSDSKFDNVIRLIRKMLKVPEKYDWESDKE